jgi:uncharacterized membrane protein YccC
MTVGYRQSLVTALACWMATLAAFALHLDNPWWAAISAWVIANPDKSALWQKGILRICGTVLGCVLGYELAVFLVAKPVPQAIAFFLLGFGTTYMRFRSKFGYSWLIGGIAALLLLAVSLDTPEALYSFAHYRAYEISCGVISAMVCDAIFAFLWRLDSRLPEAGNQSSAPKPEASDQKQLFYAALTGGLTAFLIPLLWSLFYLPSLPQTLITIVVLIDPNLDSIQFRGFQRILGCIFGGALGLIGSVIAVESLWIWSVVFLFGIAGFSRLHLGGGRWAYTGTQGGLAFIIAVVTGSGPSDTIVPVINRICGILLGVAVSVGAASFVRLWQLRQGHNSIQKSGDSKVRKPECLSDN